MLINQNEYYSIEQNRKNGFLKNVKMMKAKDFRTIRTFIERKMLKAMLRGEGRAKRYYVKGSDLIMFIAKWEAGDFHN